MSKNNRNAQSAQPPSQPAQPAAPVADAAIRAASDAAQQAAQEPPQAGAGTPLPGQGPEGPQAAAEAAPQAAPVRLRGPGRGSVSVAGVSYEADDEGHVEVAPEHVAALADHGYEQA